MVNFYLKRFVPGLMALAGLLNVAAVNAETPVCLGSDGKLVPQKLVWQEDFGTFTEKGRYWEWDYSDLENPKKVEKRTDGWTHMLDYNILGAKYQEDVSGGEGTYTVAANVTCQGDTSGTAWGWQAMTFYGKYPSTPANPTGSSSVYKTPNGYVPDHSSSAADAPEGYGAMLFLNCGNEEDTPIYEIEIHGLKPNKDYTAKCFISTWSLSGNPVKVQLRLTDMNDFSSVVSDVAKRYAKVYEDSVYNVETAWDEISASISLKGDSPKLRLQVVSVAGGDLYNENGNDLLLDDIQLWVCDDDTPAKTNFFDGYNPSIKGDSVRCFYNNSLFELSEKAPENCEYHWYLDDKLVKDGSYAYMVYGVGLSSGDTITTGDHNLACKIVSPDKTDTITVSHNYKEIGYMDLDMNEAYDIQSLSIQVKPNTDADLDKYVWQVNDKILDNDSNSIVLTYDDFVSGMASVTANDLYGCYKEGIYVPFGFSPVCFDDNNNLIYKNLIWEENFGQFNDHSLSSYRITDFSDMRNPKKVNKKTDTNSRYTFDPEPEGCSFAAEGEILDSQYAVAAAIDGYLDPDCKGCESVKQINENLIIDHSGYAEGCALYVNSGANSKDQVIFTREISGLDNEKIYEFNMFYTSFAKDEDPSNVNLKLLITEVGNPTNVVEVTGKMVEGDKSSWHKMSADILVEKSNAIKIEILNNSEEESGNNIVIDDLRLFLCGAELSNVETINAESLNDMVNVYTVSGALVKANVKRSEAFNGLANGTYIVGDKKVVIMK